MESQDRIVYSYDVIRKYIESETNLEALRFFEQRVNETVFFNALTDREIQMILEYLRRRIELLELKENKSNFKPSIPRGRRK